jgi:hypothetical protein
MGCDDYALIPLHDQLDIDPFAAFDAACERAELEVANTASFDRLKTIRDEANALEHYARNARLGRRRQNRVAAIRLRAERACGGMLAASSVGPGNPQWSQSATNTLPTGITKSQSSRWQMLAVVPDPDFEDYLADANDTDDGTTELTQADLLRIAKRLMRDDDQRRRQQQQANLAPEAAIIQFASYADWLPTQPDCDLLLTDPPYATDVDDVEQFANEWLPMALAKVKPGGRAYICIGSYPNELRAYLNIPTPEHLILDDVLGWTYRNTIGPQPTYSYKRNWQAILYYRGTDAAPLDCPLMVEQFSMHEIGAPTAPTTGRWHTWQKPDILAERFIRHATKPGDLVLDPFTCTGTFILAAARLGRLAYGCEIDPDNLAIAIERGCRHE